MELELKTDEVYEVEHERKGIFKIKVLEADKDFVRGEMVEGYAEAIHACNQKHVGDRITIATSHAKFKAVNPVL
jgi:PDZ domain-containing secreted protein